jgi:RNA polymerase sigma-70 factor (family 1)
MKRNKLLQLRRDDDGLNEKALLVQLASGHEPAFEIIYNTYWKMVYHAADRFLHSSVLAQDVVQDVFSTIWLQRKEFVKVENLEAYLKVMARNKIYSELRSWSREQKNKEEYIGQSDTFVDNCDFPILNDQNEQLLEEVLNMLPPRQKEVFVLARREGLSHDQIAEKLNVSNGTVKNHMVRALQSIRHHLAPHVNSLLNLILFNILIG